MKQRRWLARTEDEGINLKLGVQSFPQVTSWYLSKDLKEVREKPSRSLGKEHPRQREWQVQKLAGRSKPGELTDG